MLSFKNADCSSENRPHSGLKWRTAELASLKHPIKKKKNLADCRPTGQAWKEREKGCGSGREGQPPAFLLNTSRLSPPRLLPPPQPGCDSKSDKSAWIQQVPMTPLPTVWVLETPGPRAGEAACSLCTQLDQISQPPMRSGMDLKTRSRGPEVISCTKAARSCTAHPPNPWWRGWDTEVPAGHGASG